MGGRHRFGDAPVQLGGGDGFGGHGITLAALLDRLTTRLTRCRNLYRRRWGPLGVPKASAAGAKLLCMAQNSRLPRKQTGKGRPFPKGVSGNPGGRPKDTTEFR